MRKSDIVTMDVYSNGKDRYRVVLDAAPWYKLYSGVQDDDNVAYLDFRTKLTGIVTHTVPISPGLMKVCTRTSIPLCSLCRYMRKGGTVLCYSAGSSRCGDT